MMIEGILAEWLSKQTEAARLEVIRIQMTHLYEALREEGVHIFHCRRIINRILYGTPEPDGVSSLGEQLRKMRLLGLDESSFSLTGQLDPKAATALIQELTKLGIKQGGGDYGEESLPVQQD